MNTSDMSIDQILHASRLRINNSLNDSKVLNAVTPMGYPEAKLNEGADLIAEATSMDETQKKEYGEVDAAQDQLKTERKKGQKVYMDHVKIARIAFKGNVQAATTLELNGRRAATLSGWIKQTLNFYRALLANEEWKLAMGVYGQNETILLSQISAIEKVSMAAENVTKEKGDAQNATYERDMKIEELVNWVNDYEVIARIALSAKPQLLEKLGIVVKS